MGLVTGAMLAYVWALNLADTLNWVGGSESEGGAAQQLFVQTSVVVVRLSAAGI